MTSSSSSPHCNCQHTTKKKIFVEGKTSDKYLFSSPLYFKFTSIMAVLMHNKCLWVIKGHSIHVQPSNYAKIHREIVVDVQIFQKVYANAVLHHLLGIIFVTCTNSFLHAHFRLFVLCNPFGGRVGSGIRASIRMCLGWASEHST